LREAKKEYIGSMPGTVLVKAKRKKKGLSIKTSGTPMELITVSALLVQEVCLHTDTDIDEVLLEIRRLLKGNVDGS